MSALPNRVPQVDDDMCEWEEWELAQKEKLERRRMRRLRSAIGVASWQWYPLFRRLALLVAAPFAIYEVHHGDRMPGGYDYYPSKYSRQTGSIGEYPCLVASRHTTVFDIAGLGQIKRGMAWLCKPSFCKWWWMAKVCQFMGAVPLLRKGKDDSPKLTESKLRQNLRCSFHSLSEYLDRIMAVFHRGGTANIFPQAERKRRGDEVVQPKPGAAILAYEGQVPLVPMSIVGAAIEDPHVYINRFTGKEYPRLRPKLKIVRILIAIPCRLKVLVLFGEPIIPVIKDPALSLADIQEIQQELMEELSRRINDLTAEGSKLLRSAA